MNTAKDLKLNLQSELNLYNKTTHVGRIPNIDIRVKNQRINKYEILLKKREDTKTGRDFKIIPRRPKDTSSAFIMLNEMITTILYSFGVNARRQQSQ